MKKIEGVTRTFGTDAVVYQTAVSGLSPPKDQSVILFLGNNSIAVLLFNAIRSASNLYSMTVSGVVASFQ